MEVIKLHVKISQGSSIEKSVGALLEKNRAAPEEMQAFKQHAKDFDKIFPQVIAICEASEMLRDKLKSKRVKVGSPKKPELSGRLQVKN